MKKLLLLFLSVGLIAATDDTGEKKQPKPRFALGKETTFVTEPLDADGYIDYVAAVNKHWSRDVTPANNANVLIWKALRPHPEGVTMPEEFFKRLGIEPLPEQGDYFVPLSRFAREQLKLNLRAETKAIDDELTRCSQRSWKALEHPNIAAWLKANEKSLALVVEASKRTHYYMPLVPKRTKDGALPLINARVASAQSCRELTKALLARALLRTDGGRFEEAWQDLLACHRLSRLVARGATLIELLVGIALDEAAGKADQAFLESVDWKAEKLNKCLRELRELPPMSQAADKMDFESRLSTLDLVVMIDRYGLQVLENLPTDEPPKAPSPTAEPLRASVDFEPTLRSINRWYDRIAKTLRVNDRTTREMQLAQLDADLKDLLKKTKEPVAGKLESQNAKDSAKFRGERLGDILISYLLPAFHKVQTAADRCEQNKDNLYLAFALAAYKRDHGRYPKDLDLLAPKYLDKIPKDLFSGEPLIYRSRENAYLLYSVGVNGRDQLGRGDDLSIRMPLPKSKQK